MQHKFTKVFLSLSLGFILALTACSAKTAPPTATSTPQPTATQTSEKKPVGTVTRTVRIRATNTPLGGRAPTQAPKVNTQTTNPLLTTSPKPGQSKTVATNNLSQSSKTATQTLLPTGTSEFTETITPTGPTPTPTITFTPTPIQNNGPITLVDGLGRTVNLPGPAIRVVSLAPSNTEILFAVGAGPQTVGMDALSDFPEAALSLPTVGGSGGNFDLQAILTLNPDLILMAGSNDPNYISTLESHNFKVFYLANPTNLDGMYENLRKVATLTSHTQATDVLINSFKQRMTSLQQLLAPATNRPKVFVELDSTDPANVWTCGPGSFLDNMITLAGGQNIGAILSSPWGQMTTAQIAAQNPEVIILADGLYGVSVDDLASRPGWGNIRAVMDYAIYPFDDNLISRPGPRLVDGVESLAEILHYDLMP